MLFSLALVAVLLTGCAIIAVEDVRVQAVAGEDCELGVTVMRDVSGEESGTLSKGHVAGEGEQGAGNNSAITARCRSRP